MARTCVSYIYIFMPATGHAFKYPPLVSLRYKGTETYIVLFNYCSNYCLGSAHFLILQGVIRQQTKQTEAVPSVERLWEGPTLLAARFPRNKHTDRGPFRLLSRTQNARATKCGNEAATPT